MLLFPDSQKLRSRTRPINGFSGDYTSACVLNVFHLFAGNTLVMRPYCQGNPNQQWERADHFIRSRMTPNKVLEIASEYCIV